MKFSLTWGVLDKITMSLLSTEYLYYRTILSSKEHDIEMENVHRKQGSADDSMTQERVGTTGGETDALIHPSTSIEIIHQVGFYLIFYD